MIDKNVQISVFLMYILILLDNFKMIYARSLLCLDFCQDSLIWFGFEQKFHVQGDLFWYFDRFISFDQLYQCNLGLKKSKLFANAVSETSTKANECIRMKIVTFLFPSLWPEHIWVLKVFRVIMITSRLGINYGSFCYRNIFYVIILCGYSQENAISRPVNSSSFILNPINIGQLFQVFQSNVLIRFDNCVYFIANSFVDFGVISDIVGNHRKEPACCVSSCNKESLKFINEFNIRIRKLFFIVHFFIDQGFNDVCAFLFSWRTFHFFSPLLQYLCCFPPHQGDSFFHLSYTVCQAYFPGELSKEYNQRILDHISSFRGSFNNKLCIIFSLYDLIVDVVMSEETLHHNSIENVCGNVQCIVFDPILVYSMALVEFIKADITYLNYFWNILLDEVKVEHFGQKFSFFLPHFSFSENNTLSKSRLCSSYQHFYLLIDVWGMATIEFLDKISIDELNHNLIQNIADGNVHFRIDCPLEIHSIFMVPYSFLRRLCNCKSQKSERMYIDCISKALQKGHISLDVCFGPEVILVGNSDNQNQDDCQ